MIFTFRGRYIKNLRSRPPRLGWTGGSPGRPWGGLSSSSVVPGASGTSSPRWLSVHPPPRSLSLPGWGPVTVSAAPPPPSDVHPPGSPGSAGGQFTGETGRRRRCSHRHERNPPQENMWMTSKTNSLFQQSWKFFWYSVQSSARCCFICIFLL